MASVALSTKAVGSIVKLKEDGVQTEYIVVHQGRPSTLYDTSCDGTWLLRKNIHWTQQWHTSDINDYANSYINQFLNETFFNKFEPIIKGEIQQVKIPYRPGSGVSNTINSGENGLSCKLFLLSCYEVGWTNKDDAQFPPDGAKLTYFISGTTDAANNKRVTSSDAGVTPMWWLRSPYLATSMHVCYVYGDGTSNSYNSTVRNGIRPALVLPSSTLVSDNGSIPPNTAPGTPASITIPDSILGGTTIPVLWGASTDAEGNLAGYAVERSVNGSTSWNQIYRGNARNTTDIVDFGTQDVAYRVRAYDSEGLYSGYKTSSRITVINNNPPTISSDYNSGTNLGTKSEGFELTYQVNDADGNTVTVKEYLDNTLKRSYTATLGASNTFECVTADHFHKVLNGPHTLKIVANDGTADSAAYTVTFTKKVTSATITLAEPLASDNAVTMMVMSLAGSLPDDANLAILVTNNAKDTTPAWEDATADVRNGNNHLFANQAAQNGFAFNFKLTVGRGESDTGGHIFSIDGAFE